MYDRYRNKEVTLHPPKSGIKAGTQGAVHRKHSDKQVDLTYEMDA